MTFFTTSAQLQAAINAIPAFAPSNPAASKYIPFDAFYYANQYMGAYAGTLSPLEHFVQIGADRGYKPSASFDPVFYAARYDDVYNKGFNSADLLYHFLKFGLDEGRLPNASYTTFNGTAYLEANPDVKAAATVDALKAFGNSIDNFAIAHFVKFGQIEGRLIPSATASGQATTSLKLSTAVEALNGSAASDSFVGNLADNANTFQSGDSINGGAGIDKLSIELGNSSNFAIRASTTSVEQVFITSQSTDGNGSSGNNNVDQGAQVITVDAEKMVGVSQWWSTDSRADLRIEDIRIQDSQVTKDITIGLRNTDAGSTDKVDLQVYFSPESLRPVGAVTTGALTLSLSNQLPVATGFDAAKPLKNVPYTQLNFKVGTTEVLLNIDTAAVTTFTELFTALKAAVLTNPLTAGITVTQNVGAYAYFSVDGAARVADTFTFTPPTGSSLATAAIGWGTAKGLPPDNSFSAAISPLAPASLTSLITSTIILDNVGREDEAGNLTIGSMSTHGGVERFEVTVENNGDNAYTGTPSGSWLGNMSSTNNTLREVSVKNDTVGNTNPDFLYLGTNADVAGNNLTTMQDWPGMRVTDAKITPISSSLLNTDGLTDVRVFDASAMTGEVFVGASITANTIRKYQNLVDTVAHGADDVAFEYKTGSGDDSINLAIDGTVAASASTVVVGRHDFSFLVDGGAGSDNIQVSLTNGAAGGAANWYNNQAINNNVTVNGGAGNDTIRTPGAGNVKINGGAGNDTIYADNTGNDGLAGNSGRAVYVFNVADGSAAVNNQYNVNDLKSQDAASVLAVNANLTVTYKGITKTVVIGDSAGKLANVAINDLTVNQAIKDAINNDAVLSKLLVARDGPGRTLGVLSMIDGADVSYADLGVTFGTTGALTPGQTTAGVTLFTTTSNTLTDGYLTTNFGQSGNGAAAVAEVFVATFGATFDADSVTFDGVGAIALTAAQTGTQNALQYATAYNLLPAATWTAVASAATVTFTTKTPVAVAPDIATANFVVTSGGAGADIAVTAAAPTTQGVNAVVNMTGANSTTTSDNTITGGTENDVIVLGTTVGTIGLFTDVATGLAAAKLLASNDTVVYGAGAFGNDTIVNFGAATAQDVTGTGVAREVFTATFGATVDADTVAFDGLPAIALTAASNAIVNAGTYATAYNLVAARTFNAVNNGDGTVTFTKIAAGIVADVVTANFVVASAGAGADVTVTAAVPAVQGSAFFVNDADTIDFTGMGGASAAFGAALTTDKSINVVATLAAGNTEAAVGTLFAAANVAAQSHVYVAVDVATNIGSVYQVADAVGATNAVATLVGTIDLADTLWSTLTAANFA